MTEEIIINSGRMAGITTFKNEIDRLEQENKELIEDNLNLSKENEELKKQLSSTKCYLCGEGFLTPEGAELYEEKEQYRSALEEINRTLLGVRGLSINCNRQIGKVKAIINEVLGEK